MANFIILKYMAYHDNKSRGWKDGKKMGKKVFGKRSFGGNDSGRFSMHKATCSKCGNECEVPFKPSPSKPVFCNHCFKKDSNMGSGFNKPIKTNEQSKDHFEILNKKLDKILKILTS